MSYELICEGASTSPVITGDVLDACTDAGGTVAWVEVSGIVPDLTIAQGSMIAVAILGLWAFAFGISAVIKTAED